LRVLVGRVTPCAPFFCIRPCDALDLSRLFGVQRTDKH